MAANPKVSVHLDGVVEVVMIDGDAEVRTDVGDELADRLAAASNAKFPEYKMTAASYRSSGVIAIRIRKVIAWTDISKDPTRFGSTPRRIAPFATVADMENVLDPRRRGGAARGLASLCVARE